MPTKKNTNKGGTETKKDTQNSGDSESAGSAADCKTNIRAKLAELMNKKKAEGGAIGGEEPDEEANSGDE